MIKQIIPFVIATILIVVGMVYQGQQTNRWVPTNSELLDKFTQRIGNVPATVSTWNSIETPLSEEEFARTNCTGYVSRVYSDQQREVSVYLVVGTARHVTIHSPDWCYVGAGFDMESDPQPFSIDVDNETHEFTTATFIKKDNTGSKRLRIFWSYTDDGNWLAPSWPKTFFAGKTALCKVYLITNISETDNDVAGNSSIEFAKDFLPLLNENLFTEESETDETVAAL